ncbi:MAG: hypothetical protein ABSH27_05975 [Solirubrobacteraceae bacterium]|jgi:hypothetical protein
MTDRDEQHSQHPEGTDADEIPLGDLEVGDEAATNVIGGAAAATQAAPTESVSLSFAKIATSYKTE